ncbi:hypothetical protein CHH69_14640, partial [Terribacillus saccharophilus]
ISLVKDMNKRVKSPFIRENSCRSRENDKRGIICIYFPCFLSSSSQLKVRAIIDEIKRAKFRSFRIKKQHECVLYLLDLNLLT